MALTRADIVSAALALLDEVGLEGLSTRRLAERLGVRGPSLYWHVKTMAELRDHMAEAILAEAMGGDRAAALEGDWRAWLADGARGYRRAALSRRDGARLLSMAKPTGTRPDLSYPAMVQRLRAAGFSAADAHDSMMAIGRYVLGWVLFEQASDDLDREHGFEFGLRAMLDGLGQRVAASAA